MLHYKQQNFAYSFEVKLKHPLTDPYGFITKFSQCIPKIFLYDYLRKNIIWLQIINYTSDLYIIETFQAVNTSQT